MPSQKSCLSEVLNFWKDACLLTEVLLEIRYGKGREEVYWYPEPVRYWREFERLVMDNSVRHLRTPDWMGFPTKFQTHMFLAGYDTFPLEFFQWSRRSRRMFEIPRDLQRAFASATFPEIRWGDILWPFDSFMIRLSEPIRSEDRLGKWTTSDTILVSNLDVSDLRTSSRLLVFRLIGKSYDGDEEPRLSEQKIKRVKLLIKRGNHAEAEKLMLRLWEERNGVLSSAPGWRHIMMTEAANPDSKIQIEAPDLVKGDVTHLLSDYKCDLEEKIWRASPTSWAVKIAVGTALYLQSLDPAKALWRNSEPHVRQKGNRGVTGIITDPEYICSIVGHGTIDPSRYGLQEPPNKEGSQFFVRPHWRRAHLRRPPGAPHDAERTVKIPPVLVREDLVPQFGIISGTKTKILPEE